MARGAPLMEDSALVEDRKAGAHRTLTALVIMMSALFVGSLLFMVLSGDQRSPEGRRVLAVLAVQGSNPGTVADRFAGSERGWRPILAAPTRWFWVYSDLPVRPG